MIFNFSGLFNFVRQQVFFYNSNWVLVEILKISLKSYKNPNPNFAVSEIKLFMNNTRKIMGKKY